MDIIQIWSNVIAIWMEVLVEYTTLHNEIGLHLLESNRDWTSHSGDKTTMGYMVCIYIYMYIYIYDPALPVPPSPPPVGMGSPVQE